MTQNLCVKVAIFPRQQNHNHIKNLLEEILNGSKYSKMDRVKFVKKAFTKTEVIWFAFFKRLSSSNFTSNIFGYLDPNNNRNQSLYY